MISVFFFQTEAPLMIKPLLPNMTKSELHAVMTGGFATIAGSVLATYILFGVSMMGRLKRISQCVNSVTPASILHQWQHNCAFCLGISFVCFVHTRSFGHSI